jgi:hypothetical protein
MAIATLVFEVLMRFMSVVVMLSRLYRNNGKRNEDSHSNKKKKSNR